MRRFSPEKNEAILEMARTRPELSYKEIAEAFQCSDSYVHELARKAGISRAHKNKLSPEKLKEIQAIARTHPDFSYEKIGSLVGLHEMTVSRIARQVNGLRRPISAEQDAKIERELRRALFEGGYSRMGFIKEIAAKIGCTPNHVAVVQRKTDLTRKQKYWSYEEAQQWVHTKGITSCEVYCDPNTKLPLRLPANPDKAWPDKWISWPAFLGSGIWTRVTVLAYLRDIQSLLPSLSDADLLKLLRETGLLAALQLKTSGGIAEVLRALRGGELPQHITGDQFVDEGVKESDYESPETEIDVHAADRAKGMRASTKTIQHIIGSQLAALRANWFREGEVASTLMPLFTNQGGEFFQEIGRRFLEEVTAVESLATPWWGLHKNGKLVPPSPMQKYVAWRLKKDRVFGNWSGTGAGKTDSAGLAAYVIGSELTVILSANSTVVGWQEQLEETFPGCRVYTKMAKVQRGQGNFLVLNYERFQTPHARAIAEKVTALRPDFVVLDEVQLVKQRGGEASNRSLVISEMLSQLPKARVLGMSATPVINELREGISLLETIKQETLPLKSKATIPNALDLFAALRQIGVRYLPKYEQKEETVKVSTQRDDLLVALQDADDILPIEQILLPAKLEAIKDRIKPGTVLYLEYVEGMVKTVRYFMESLGYSVGEYVGDTDALAREEVKKQFIAGEIDVLIGSRAISVGVDGLQQRCDQLILLSLPWTHAGYAQVVGRVYRQGGTGIVQIVIPQVIVDSNGGRWSWDEARMKHIESKRTLAECATDGVIPTTSTLSRKVLAVKAIEALNKLSKKAKASAV
jgi:superfamily II DNA or RNA helicase